METDGSNIRLAEVKVKSRFDPLSYELSYVGMEIADGMAAMQAYHDMCALEPGEELDQLRKAMLEYCRLDTLGMVRILKELESLV